MQSRPEQPDQAHKRPEDAVDQTYDLKDASNVLPRVSIHDWESSSLSRSFARRAHKLRRPDGRRRIAMKSTGNVQRARRPFFVTLLLSTMAVACAVKIATVTGPDGNPWQTCDGNDAKCIEAMGVKCPNGYIVGHEKLFKCKPDHADDQGPCVTDKELETRGVFAIDDADNVFELRPGHLASGTEGPLMKAKPVRGPDCHAWLMRPRFDWSSSSTSSTSRFLKLLGHACRHGYIEAELFGEAMYQCTSAEDAGEPDAIAPLDAMDSQ
jgi:hypothetical protein